MKVVHRRQASAHVHKQAAARIGLQGGLPHVSRVISFVVFVQVVMPPALRVHVAVDAGNVSCLKCACVIECSVCTYTCTARIKRIVVYCTNVAPLRVCPQIVLFMTQSRSPAGSRNQLVPVLKFTSSVTRDFAD